MIRASSSYIGRIWRTRAINPESRCSVSSVHTASVHDADISRLAAITLRSPTLTDLIKCATQALYDSANAALSILPVRLAHRIQSLRNLPFIVVTNPNVSQIHGNYLHSLSTLLPFAETKIDSDEDEHRFVEVMSGLVNTHAHTIPVLAQGFLETRKYISPQVATAFLDEHLRVRIGTRMIAEQHIALHYASRRSPGGSKEHDEHGGGQSSYIGVIDLAMKPASIVRSCEAFVSDICELKYGVRPRVVINGEPEARIAQVPVHLEYIMTELLKNAFRATIERGNEREPIEVTIAPGLDQTSPEATSTSHLENATAKGRHEPSVACNSAQSVTIRIRDQGGGIDPEYLDSIWNYSFTTFNDEASGAVGLSVISGSSANASSLAGLGYGLPLSRAYAEYFGGSIAVQSLWGWGTDVYLTLRGVGKVA